MNPRRTVWMTAWLVLAVGASLSADRVRLRSGKVIQGSAIVGGIAGGGKGAAIGAAVGTVEGVAVASGGEQHLKIPCETRLQFQLSAAVNIKP